MRRIHAYCDHCGQEMRIDPEYHAAVEGIRLRAIRHDGTPLGKGELRADITKMSGASIISSAQAILFGEYCGIQCFEAVVSNFIEKVKEKAK